MEMLGAITGLIGAGLQYQAQQDQLQEQYAALNWQKQRADQQDWFAQAGKVDQYGNKTGYNRALNQWDVTLSPEQKQISDAGQKEQLLQLTQDAPAARKIRQAVQQRAEYAKEPFNTAQLGYQYDQPDSPEAIQSKLTGLMATNDMVKSKADQALMMRSAARLGQGAKASEIINATDQALGNSQNQNNRMLQARQDALKEYAGRQQLHEQQWGAPMKMWGDLMTQGGDLPNIQKMNVADTTGAQQQAMLQAFNSGTQGVGSAMNNVASAMGKSPDLSSVAKILADIGKNKGGKTKSSGDDTISAGDSDGGVSIFSPSTYDTSRNDYGTTDDYNFSVFA